jgi:hypothetical protein
MNMGMNLIDESDYKSFHELKKNNPLAFDEVYFDNSILYELPVPYILACVLSQDGIVQIGRHNLQIRE